MDEIYMKRALMLAKRGEGWVSPNPAVGAVIVKKGRIIGEGYHRKFGGDHAEIDALNRATESVKGAEFFITLEPCTHHGKTPPCIHRLVEASPSRVVIGLSDPNPLVCGKGIEILRKHGIETKVGVLEKECREINEKFFKYIQRKIPFVTVKFAQSLDGRIATAAGHSRWISSPSSLKFAHRERSLHDAVLAGVGTIVRDDPQLTVRLVRGRHPLRIVLDSHLRIPSGARILQQQDIARTILVATGVHGKKKRALVEKMGIEVWQTDQDQGGRVDLKKMLALLGEKGISSLLVEGGAETITSFLKENLADRLLVITAPKIIGRGIEAVGELGIRRMEEAIPLIFRKIFRKGDDVIIEAVFS
ncbi:MAG: bifunctional diaminohydroxyphosphoribosylaminopyrimidine deaminase/5-amino-6-(5-phosphoribosylamino)uracil reductase RibD [Syntrophales bacterium]